MEERLKFNLTIQECQSSVLIEYYATVTQLSNEMSNKEVI